MKRIISFILIVSVLVLSIGPIEAKAASKGYEGPGFYQVVTKKDNLYIRNDSGKAISSMKKGTVVLVTETKKNDTWGRVHYNAITGWSSMSYLKKVYSQQAYIDICRGDVESISFAGWCFDCADLYSGNDKVHVYLDDQYYGEFAANQSRPDVNDVFNGVGENHGFSGSFPATPGVHDVRIYQIGANQSGINPLIGNYKLYVSSQDGDNSNMYTVADINGEPQRTGAQGSGLCTSSAMTTLLRYEIVKSFNGALNPNQISFGDIRASLGASSSPYSNGKWEETNFYYAHKWYYTDEYGTDHTFRTKIIATGAQSIEQLYDMCQQYGAIYLYIKHSTGKHAIVISRIVKDANNNYHLYGHDPIDCRDDTMSEENVADMNIFKKCKKSVSNFLGGIERVVAVTEAN